MLVDHPAPVVTICASGLALALPVEPDRRDVWMLGVLGATLIVFAVMHLATVAVLAWWPLAGRVPALLAAACAAGAGCVVDARLVPGHLAAAVVAGAAAMLVAAGYARMSRWLHPVGAAV